MFDTLVVEAVGARSPAARVGAFARVENAACAARLSAMAEMLAAVYAEDGSAEREQWRFDNWSAVCAQIGAAHAVTSGIASGLLMDAVALSERLPRVGALFATGALSYRMVHQICTRTMLVKDPDAQRAIDTGLAREFASAGALSVDQAEKMIDGLVLAHDPFAVRRGEVAARAHRVTVHVDDASGTGYLEASMSVTDICAVDKRADALARTVCAHDPRTLDARRSAALGAMGFGWDRLPCLCEREDCEAAARPAVGGIVIHVIAREDTINGGSCPAPEPPAGPDDPDGPEVLPPGEPESGGPPVESDSDPAQEGEPEVELEPEPAAEADSGSEPEQLRAPTGDLTAQRRALVGEQASLLSKPWYKHTLPELAAALSADRGEFCPVAPAVILGGAVLPAPVLAQAARHARIERLIHPGQAPPGPQYRPSKALADFVRCRDGTCRFPGCTRAATITDIDHTVPYPFGPTAASNLVCLCREHHLAKTFWAGWDSRQSPDGTVVWTDPEGHSHTTYPGSRWLFAELCAPTAEVTIRGTVPPKHTAGLMMPRRTATRAQARRQRIDDERRRNIPWAEQYLREQIPPH